MSKYTIYLTRLKETDKETIGILSVYCNHKIRSFATVELPYKDNKQNISAIPAGVYNYIKWRSPTFKTDVIRLLDVEGRSNILIHPANFVKELRGCIGIGYTHMDIDGDGEEDVYKSRAALKELLSCVPDKGTIYISYV